MCDPKCRGSAPVSHFTPCSATDTQLRGPSACVSSSWLLLPLCHSNANPVPPSC